MRRRDNKRVLTHTPLGALLVKTETFKSIGNKRLLELVFVCAAKLRIGNKRLLRLVFVCAAFVLCGERLRQLVFVKGACFPFSA